MIGTFDPNKPAFSIPEFTPMFVQFVPLTINIPLAQMLASLIKDSYEETNDPPAIFRFGNMLRTFCDNVQLFAQGQPRAGRHGGENEQMFYLPEFAPLYRDSVSIVLSRNMAELLAAFIQDAFSPDEKDHPSLFAIGAQLRTYAQNCQSHLIGQPTVRQRPERRPAYGTDPSQAQRV